MGQEVVNSVMVPEGLPDPEPPAPNKRVEYSYTREVLLSFADLESCKKRPENLDPVIWRNASAADGVEGGVAIPAISSRGLVRRDSRESEALSKSPVDLPEWRKDSRRSGGSAALVLQGPRRKTHDDELSGNAFSTSYPPRPAGSWVDNGYQRNSFERPALQGQGSGRWEHRAGFPDREREVGRLSQKWDGEEIVAAPVVSLETLRPEIPLPFGSTGSVVRPGWLPAERDGLLGSGGVLHRTFTGSFMIPSALRAGPERQMSMGPPKRQISLGLQDRQMSMGLVERQMGMGLPERQMTLGPPERQMSMGPPERQMSIVPERQMSLGLPDRQNSSGRGVSRISEPYHPSRPLKSPPFARREETDFVNDETFGSKSSSTDERTEQERLRREAFELMRKDHQRLLQKQQKLLSQKHEERLANPVSVASRKHDESSLWDSALSYNIKPSSPPRSPEKKSLDSETTSSAVLMPVVGPSTPRPVIPPGFAKVVQQKQTTLKASSTQESPTEGDSIDKKDPKHPGLQSAPSAACQENVLGDEANNLDDKLSPTLPDYLDKREQLDSLAPMVCPELSLTATSTEVHDYMSKFKISVGKAAEEKQKWILPSKVILDEKKDGLSIDVVKENSFVTGEQYKTNQESLLDKFFGGPKLERESTKDGEHPTPILADESYLKASNEDAWSEVDPKTSKFAQWFHQEENQSREGSGASSDILSPFPIGGSSKASTSLFLEDALKGSENSNPVNMPRSHSRILPMPTGPSLEDIEKGLTASASSGPEKFVTKLPSFKGTLSLKNLDIEPNGDNLCGVFGEHSPIGKFNFRPTARQRHSASRSSPIFLTCEDIEQSMLAEAGTSTEKSILNPGQPLQRDGGATDGKGGQAADRAASRHLLSLLQKGVDRGNHSPESRRSSHTQALDDRCYNGDEWDPISVGQGSRGAGKKSSSDNPTLEALFGKAFMSELRSVEAPLSANPNPGDFFDNMTGLQAVSGVYPINRQSLCRMNIPPANFSLSNQCSGPGPLANLGWMDSSVLDSNRHGFLKDGSLPKTKATLIVAPDKEDCHPVTSSSHRLWGNGINSRELDGGLPMNSGIASKGSFVSCGESTSLVVGDLVGHPVKGQRHLSRVHTSDLDTRTISKVNEGEVLPSGNLLSELSRVSEGCSLPLYQGKVLSSDEPVINTSTGLDSSGIMKVLKDDGLGASLDDITTAKLEVTELSTVQKEENISTASQDVDSFHLSSRRIDTMNIMEDVLAADKISLHENGNEKKMADSLSDTLGFTGKAKDVSARMSTISTAGFSEQATTCLQRSNCNSIRFKSNLGGMQPSSVFLPFHQVGPPLQHQQSIGSVYRSDSPPSLALQRQESPIPVQHHLQQNPGPGMAMFPSQQFHPQPMLPQQQPLLARTFSNGSPPEFPHVSFGHLPTTAPSRQLSAGHLHFPLPQHGHLSPPGTYPSMGHMVPTPNHFLPPGQIPQRGLSMSPIGEGHMFIPEQTLHDPHILGSNPASQQGPPQFPLGGPGLQSGQGPLFHQALPLDMRGQQNHLLPGPGPGPWDLRSYSSGLMRSASKSHELSGYVNGSGGGVNSLDRWFGMELSRSVSGIPSPGLLQLSPHGLDPDSRIRFG